MDILQCSYVMFAINVVDTVQRMLLAFVLFPFTSVMSYVCSMFTSVLVVPAAPAAYGMRTQLLALHLLEVVLPSCGSDADRQHLQQASRVSLTLSLP